MKRTSNNNNIISIELDKINSDILGLITQNYNNIQMSTALKIPLSTIQRRIRNLFENGFITSKVHLNYKKLGYKQGLVHIYLSDGNLEEILEEISKMRGIISLEVHMGNLDIHAELVYKEGSELVKAITSIKKMKGVEKTVWSEQVLEYPVKISNPPKIL
jgi:DNA-binding Lrp family transcriptional regulator